MLGFVGDALQRRVGRARGSRLDSPGEPAGKRCALWSSLAGKPQIIRLTRESGVSWVMSETLNRSP